MKKLEELFRIGTMSESVEVKGVKFTVNSLNAKVLQEALNASTGADPTAQALDYKKQILARAISQIDDEVFFENNESPKPIEVNVVLQILDRLHFTIINKIFDAYEKLDDEISKELEADGIKK